MDKPRSAKDFLHEYVKRKGISKKRFAESLGLSRNYLGSGDSISVENLQKIIRHPDYQDFNHEALLNGEGDVIKTTKVVESGFYRESVQEVLKELKKLESEEKANDPRLNQESMKILRNALGLLVNLSRDYNALSEKYHQLEEWIRRILKFKG